MLICNFYVKNKIIKSVSLFDFVSHSMSCLNLKPGFTFYLIFFQEVSYLVRGLC